MKEGRQSLLPRDARVRLAKAEDRRAQFAPRARIHDSVAGLLASERLDFVDILSPPAAHAQQCLLAKQAGLHVVCQKPLCDDDYRDATAVIDIAWKDGGCPQGGALVLGTQS